MSRSMFVSTMTIALVASAAVAGGAGCAQQDCARDAECPLGRTCRVGLCTLATDSGDVALGEDAGDASCQAPTAGSLVLNEILVDPPPGLDVDGDGQASPRGDEFVELVNVSDHAVSLATVELRVGGRAVGLGAQCLRPREAFVMFGRGGLPLLPNSGGTVSVAIDDTIIDTMTYGVEAAQDASLVRIPEIAADAPWVIHSAVSTVRASPGTCAGGEAFPDCHATQLPGPDVSHPDLREASDGGADDAATPACHIAPRPGDLIINEVLADPGALNDTNGDGIAHPTEDEFVEVLNISGETLFVQHIQLAEGGGRRVVVADPICLAPHAALVFIGGAGPEDEPSNTLWIEGGGGLSLNNAGDTIHIRDADDVIIAEARYGREGDDAQSLVRGIDMDAAAAFVRHTSAQGSAGARMSPGRCSTGAPFPDCAVPSEPPATDPEVTDPEVTDPEAGPTETPCVAPSVGDLVVNEVLVDAGGRDFNGDGLGDSGDAFVEIVNASGVSILLDSVELHVNGAVRHTFDAQCLPAGQAVVILGGDVTRPAPFGATFEAATAGTLAMQVSAPNTVVLRAPAASDLDVVAVPVDPGVAGRSQTRQPDCTRGPLVAHPPFGSGATSIGRKSDGDFFSADTCRFPPDSP